MDAGEQTVVIENPVEGRGAEHGVECLDKRQRRAIPPHVRRGVRRGLTPGLRQHRSGAVEAGDESPRLGRDLCRQTSGAAAKIEDPLTRARC